MSSSPYDKHVFSVSNFDLIKTVQRQIASQVCSGVEEQLNELVSGEEGKVLSAFLCFELALIVHSFELLDVQADVVLLVDGSYSIGLTNFAKVRAFLEVLVKSFEIGPNKVQISLVQYSRDPYTEFALNTHQSIDAVLKAVRSFPYRGGSTNTGKAMTYVREKIFVASRGARINVPRVMILITDGKSSDAFKDPATRLRNTDVEIFAVGVKDAVRSELEAIANPPADTHVYTVEDFDAFQRISTELTQSISLVAPRDLTFSEITSRSFRASWSSDSDRVESFLLKYKPTLGGDTITVSVPGDTTSTVLMNLQPLTKYSVSVFSQYENGESLPLEGEETTLEGIITSPNAKSLRVSDETETTMKVTWQPAPREVVNYRLTYRPVSGGRQIATKVPGTLTSTVLRKLTPRTSYDITVHPIFKKGEGKARQGIGTTRTKKPQNI
uniref:Collagen alpha-1(XII) chain n=1 Tax=Erpetoichthys calabaricus TaxID=27687 RepID=A0A8C4RJB1_ERPCA